MKIYLYSRSGAIDVREIEEYIRKKLGENVTRKKFDFSEKLAERMASIRVINPAAPFTKNEPLPGEIEYEKRVLKREIEPAGVIYDGFMFQQILHDLLPREERSLDMMHLFFTDRLLGTFDENDLRYHARVNIMGYPSIVSTTGIVEAPAKPRGFYIEKGITGVDTELIKEKYRSKIIDYNDQRTNEIAKGYAMQCIFYHVLGEAFCSDRRCRLYNAHWQSEVIEAQLTQPEFCKKHGSMLLELRK